MYYFKGFLWLDCIWASNQGKSWILLTEITRNRLGRCSFHLIIVMKYLITYYFQIVYAGQWGAFLYWRYWVEWVAHCSFWPILHLWSSYIWNIKNSSIHPSEYVFGRFQSWIGQLFIQPHIPLACKPFDCPGEYALGWMKDFLMKYG